MIVRKVRICETNLTNLGCVPFGRSRALSAHVSLFKIR